jgi:hypothetical protein
MEKGMYELYVFRRDGECAITKVSDGSNLPGVGWTPDRTILEGDLGLYIDKPLEQKKQIASAGYVIARARSE